MKKSLPVAPASVVAALILVLLASCGEDNPVTQTPPGPPSFHQLIGLPTVTTWEKVWGIPGGDIFVMGENGVVFRNQGLSWDSLNSTVAGDRTLFSAWGTAGNNMYFVGLRSNVGHPVVTPDSTYNVYYDDPVLENYNGLNFDAEPLSGVQWGLYDIWGSAADNIFAVGFDGTVIHYDGAGWTVQATGGVSPVWLNSVWGSTDTNVFASGTGGALLHYGSDSVWAVIPTHVFADLWDVWGLSDTSVYCVGSNGTILRYNGANFTRMTSHTTNSLYSIWGTSEDNLYAVGWGGKLLHYNGTSWAEESVQTGFGLLSLWGSGPDDIYAVGQMALHYDGVAWSPLAIRNEPNFRSIWAGSRSTAREAIAVGTGGVILKSSGGDTFSSMTVNDGKTAADLNDVAGVQDTAWFVVGDGGLILKRDETDLTNWVTIESGVTVDLKGVSALSQDLAYAVGAGGTILRWDGSSWTSVTSLTSQDLKDVWAGEVGNDTMVFIVGNAGTTTWYDGTWHGPVIGAIANLNSVTGTASGSIWAVGDNGTLLSFSGGVWTPVSLGTSENLTSIWNDNAGHLFITGEGGRTFQYNIGPATLVELDTKIGFDLNGVFGFSSTNLFVVGDFNHISHYRP